MSEICVLTANERKTLKQLAHGLKPVVLIGDKGASPAVLKEIDLALSAHQLIKIRMTGDDRQARLTMIETITETTQAVAVQHIGKLVVIYRSNPQKAPVAAGPAVKPAKPAALKTAASPTKARSASAAKTARSTPRANGQTAGSGSRPRRPKP